MKTFSLNLLACLCVCASLYAQEPILDKNAAILFENSNSTLSNAEKNEIFKKTGFALSANGSQFFLKDDLKTADSPFDVRVIPLDLNFDGIEEIAIEFGKLTDSPGITEVNTFLFVKDMEGNYSVNFGSKGTLVFLNLNPLTQPDILFRSRNPGFPVWRWDGMKYNMHEQFDNKRLRKMEITYLSEASRDYTVKAKK